MKKLETKVLENFRTFGDDDKITFRTELQCRNCGKISGNYILIEGWIRVCKGCLTDWVKELDKNRLQHVVNSKRGE